MDHRLFVAKQLVPQPGVLLERLSYARNVSVPENSQASPEELELFSVSFGKLIFQESNSGLSRGQTYRHKAMPLLNRVTPRTCLLQDFPPLIRKT